MGWNYHLSVVGAHKDLHHYAGPVSGALRYYPDIETEKRECPGELAASRLSRARVAHVAIAITSHLTASDEIHCLAKHTHTY